MYQVVEIVGSLLILSGYLAALAGRLDQSGYTYLGVNAVGSAILSVTAFIGVQWGFLLLEGVWSLASLYSIGRKATRRPVAASH